MAGPQQLIGAARSREIIINIDLPNELIYSSVGKLGDLEERLNYIIQISKEASDNKLIRFMKNYIFGNEKKMLQLLISEKQVQGMMQVYQDFCTQSQNNCLHCPFPDVIRKYFS